MLIEIFSLQKFNLYTTYSQSTTYKHITLSFPKIYEQFKSELRDVSKLLWKSTCEYKYLSISALPRDVEPMLSDTLSDLAVLPHRDKYGRRIIVYKMWDAEKWPYKKGMEAFYAINLLLSREAKTQVAGITMIGDFSGMSRKHMSTNMEDIRAWSNLISVIKA